MTGRQSSRWNGSAITRTRSIAANAPALPTDAMNAVTLVGEPWYTSGVQTWNGTAATLNAEPDDEQRDTGQHDRVRPR